MTAQLSNMPNFDKEKEQERWMRQLHDDYEQLVRVCEDLEAKAFRFPEEIESDEELGRQGDMVVEMRTVWKRLEANRDAENAPVLAHNGAINQFFKGYQARLEGCSKQITARQNAFKAKQREAEQKRLAEEQRKAREEADRVEAEARAAREKENAARLAAARAKDEADRAEAERKLKLLEAEREQKAAEAEKAANEAALATKAATVKPADLVRTRSQTGASLYTEQEYWTFEVEDIGVVPLGKLREHFERKHIESAIRDYVNKGGRELPGVRIFSATRSINR